MIEMSINNIVDYWLACQLVPAQTGATLLHLLPTDFISIIVMRLVIAYYLMNNQSTCKSKLYHKLSGGNLGKFSLALLAQSSTCCHGDLHTQVPKFWNLVTWVLKKTVFVSFEVFSGRISFEMKRFRVLLLPTMMGWGASRDKAV